MRLKNITAILLLALFLRLVNLNNLPAWEWDEGSMLNLSENLLEGRPWLFALKYPFVPHPPLFFLSGALTIKLLGASILSMRLLTALFGAATAAAIYATGREFIDEKTGFLGGLLYAIYPAAVFWNRTAIANNQVVLLSTISLYFILKFIQEKKRIWLAMASAFSGLSFVTGFIGAASIMSVLLLTMKFDRKNVMTALVCSISLPAVYSLIMLSIMPEAFLWDLSHHLNRTMVGASAQEIQLSLLVLVAIAGLVYVYKSLFNAIRSLDYRPLPAVYLTLGLFAFYWIGMDYGTVKSYGIDYLTFISVIGLFASPMFLVRKREVRAAVSSYLLLFIALLFLFDRTDHMTMVVYPYIAFGMASLMRELFKISSREFHGRLPCAAFCSALLVFHPIALCVLQDFLFVSGKIYPPADLNMIAEVSDYLNEHTNGGDVVLTYSWMTQLLTSAQGGIVIQALAYDGYNAAYYPGNYPKERWAFNTSLSNAKYIVLSEEDKKNFGGKDEKSHSVLVAELGRRSIAFNNGLEVYGPRVQSSP